MDKYIKEVETIEASDCARLLDAWYKAAQALESLAGISNDSGFPEFSREAKAISGTMAERLSVLLGSKRWVTVERPLLIGKITYHFTAVTLNATIPGNFSSPS